MEKVDVVSLLRSLNPRADQSVIEMYADLFADYQAAQKNIAENGAIVFHPRTGAPIDNPFLRVRDSAVARMLKIRLKTGDLWSIR